MEIISLCKSVWTRWSELCSTYGLHKNDYLRLMTRGSIDRRNLVKIWLWVKRTEKFNFDAIKMQPVYIARLPTWAHLELDFRLDRSNSALRCLITNWGYSTDQKIVWLMTDSAPLITSISDVADTRTVNAVSASLAHLDAFFTDVHVVYGPVWCVISWQCCRVDLPPAESRLAGNTIKHQKVTVSQNLQRFCIFWTVFNLMEPPPEVFDFTPSFCWEQYFVQRLNGVNINLE